MTQPAQRFAAHQSVQQQQQSRLNDNDIVQNYINFKTFDLTKLCGTSWVSTDNIVYPCIKTAVATPYDSI